MEGTVGQVEREKPGPEESRHTNGVRRITDRVRSVIAMAYTQGEPWSREEKGYHINRAYALLLNN